ncbi:MAG: hypothetical protein E7Z68_07450 [Thermoplasmata archaeon]|nr:hypothetical protein [Thermoplasmata archaeon]
MESLQTDDPSVVREVHLDQEVDTSFAFDLYKSYLYHKALGRYRRGRPRASFSLLRHSRAGHKSVP